MTQILVLLVVIVGLTVFPVMLAARIVGAGNTGFGSALLAVFLHTCLSAVTKQSVSSESLAILIAIIGGSAIFSFTLDTTFLRGLAISFLVVVITIIAVVILGWSLGVFSSAT